MGPVRPGNGAHVRLLPRMLAALLAVAALSCMDTPLAPVAPEWDVTMTVPLVHRSHSLADLVAKDPSMLRSGTGGLITYAASLDVRPTLIGNRIAISPRDTAVNFAFGPFAVAAPPLSTGISLSLLPPGVPIIIPDTAVTAADVPLSVPTFEEITFAAGELLLSVRNDLPVAVGIPSPVLLVDAAGRTVASFVFSEDIPPGAEAAAAEDVTGRTADNDLRITGVRVRLHASSGPVVLPTGDQLRITLASRNLRARSAVLADIPPQRLVDNDVALLPLDDSTLVREARFASGRLRFSFVNRVPLGMVFSFRVDALSREGSAGVYRDSVVLPAQGSGFFDLDFTRLRLQAPGTDFLRDLQVVSTISLPSGSGGRVTVHDTDRVEVQVALLSPLVVDTAVAVIRPTWVDVDAPVAVDFGSWPTRFSGSLDIPAAQLNLGTALSFGFPTDLYLTIGARRTPGGPWVYLHVPSTQKRIQPGASTIRFVESEVGAFLSEFAGGFPDSFHIQGSVHVNPPEVYSQTLAAAGAIGARSSIGAAVDLSIPLRLGLSGGRYADTLTLGDTTGDGSRDYAVDKDRLRRIGSGVLYLDVENRLPLAVGLRTRLLDAAGRVLLTIPQDGGTVRVNAAEVDGSGGTTGPVAQRRSIALSQAEVRTFDPAAAVAYDVEVETPPGAGPVQFRIEDYVRVRIWSVFSYRVTP